MADTAVPIWNIPVEPIVLNYEQIPLEILRAFEKLAVLSCTDVEYWMKKYPQLAYLMMSLQ